MKKTLKKITALLLTALFMINVFPTNVSALDNINDNISELVAEEKNNSRSIARYFGKTCPIGTSSNYTEKIGSSKDYDITLSTQDLTAVSQDKVSRLMVDVFSNFLGHVGIAIDVFYDAAARSIEAQAFADADPNAMSLRITTYKNPTHSIGGNEYYQYKVDYFKQAGCKYLICTMYYYEAITTLS